MAKFTGYIVGSPIKLKSNVTCCQSPCINLLWGGAFASGEKIAIGDKVRIVTKSGKMWIAKTHSFEGIRYIGKRHLQVWVLENANDKEEINTKTESKESDNAIAIDTLMKAHINKEISDVDFVAEFKKLVSQ